MGANMGRQLALGIRLASQCPNQVDVSERPGESKGPKWDVKIACRAADEGMTPSFKCILEMLSTSCNSSINAAPGQFQLSYITP